MSCGTRPDSARYECIAIRKQIKAATAPHDLDFFAALAERFIPAGRFTLVSPAKGVRKVLRHVLDKRDVH